MTILRIKAQNNFIRKTPRYYNENRLNKGEMRPFHDTLAGNGIESRLYLEGHGDNHLSLYPKGSYMRIDVFVTSDYRLQVSFDNPRIVADSDKALKIISVFSQKEAATA